MNENGSYHIPVMVKECMEGLAIKKGGTYVDCTLGGGGHFSAIIGELCDTGTVIGIDRDPESLEWVRTHLKKTITKIILQQTNFSELDRVLLSQNVESVDGILLDLGISSHHIDDSNRGFSYMSAAKLDMRMNSNDEMTAQSLIKEKSEAELADIFRIFGEVRNPSRMAAAIKGFSSKNKVETSQDLRRCLKEEYGERLPVKVIAKVFQALRIVVNDELEELRVCLSKTVRCLKRGGRLVVVSYHSLEDRIVKNFIRGLEGVCECPPLSPVCTCGLKKKFKRINKKVIKPRQYEVEINSRARSARLRIAERV